MGAPDGGRYAEVVAAVITQQQADELVDLIRRKGFRVRGRGGFLDRLGVGDAVTTESMSRESWEWAIQYLSERPDVEVIRG